jgi:ATPase subunit of ABC transporter with duplicated ATPase domains
MEIKKAEELVDSDSGDSDAPDDIGFSDAKAKALSTLAEEKETRVKEAKKKKEQRTMQMHKFKEQKEEKRKRKAAVMEEQGNQNGGDEKNQLSMEFLARLDEANHDLKKAKKTKNKVKKLAEVDDDDEITFPPSKLMPSGVSVVSRRDERGLAKTVAPSVLDFKQRMLNDPRKNRREAASVVIARKNKMAVIGGNNFVS